MIQVYPTHNRISSAELKENKREQDPIGEVASRPSPYLKLTPPPARYKLTIPTNLSILRRSGILPLTHSAPATT